MSTAETNNYGTANQVILLAILNPCLQHKSYRLQHKGSYYSMDVDYGSAELRVSLVCFREITCPKSNVRIAVWQATPACDL